LTSTIKGLKWFLELEDNEEHFTEEGHITARNGTHSVLVTNETLLEPFILKLEYKIETYVLLGIPILISIVMTLFCFAVIGVLAHQYTTRVNHNDYQELDEF